MPFSLVPEDEDTNERLSADDMATRREAEFLAAALRVQAAQAAATAHVAGVCGNCREACLPLAVYCDEDCRADHEWRLRRGLK